MDKERFIWKTRPLAAAENIVTCGNVRVTVLTDCLLRIEYCDTGRFEDRASQTVFYRDFAPCTYQTVQDGVWLTAETAALRLCCRTDVPFSADTLAVALKNEPASYWHYGDEPETLKGTTKTLDGVNDGIPLEDGLCSRLGYALLDDSKTMLLSEDGWVMPRPAGTTDLYFFGYGYDYRRCIADYYRLTGIPPMLPAYALGNWWSRYYAYTQEEYEALMLRFEQEDIPFSVAVVDMDWHTVDVPEDKKPPRSDFEQQCDLREGWTGYTWNEKLFPDYKKFLAFLHEHHEKVALNLHPAGGVCPHEVQYPAMAKAMGIDPVTKERVRFDILSPQFMAHYFDILHHPYENDGVDFWWMDWQQGTDYRWVHMKNKPGEYADERERLDPLWMLNHLHILDISRNGKRPMFFSRYSGPGSQRYPIGFSGDTVASWDALKFQPYFTATASNIGYGWWSHDIGGHAGYTDPELMTRWIQLGVFSPILRIHSGQSEFLRKEPWSFSGEYRPVIEHSLRLRYRLFPYLYTMNYRCHNELRQLVEPMYYAYPKCDEAYRVPNQFMFGSELMIAPVTTIRDRKSGLAETEVWLPKGDWFDLANGLHYAAADTHRCIRTFRPIDGYPAFAKAGAIVPMMVQPPHEHRCMPAQHMELLVFPGASNAFTLYEDEGEGFAYENGRFAKTQLTLDWQPQKSVFTVHPAVGDLSVIPQVRLYTIRLRGFHRDTTAAVSVGGVPVAADAVYDKASNTLTVEIRAAVTDEVRVELTADALMHDNADQIDHCGQILLLADIFVGDKHKILDILQRQNVSVHDRVAQLTAQVPSEYPIILALREMLTLTKGEYENGSCE